jgi:hypothetical protein
MNPNPNPKDVGVLPRCNVGSVVLDHHDGFREVAPRHRRPTTSDPPKYAAVDALASKAHRIRHCWSPGRGPRAPPLIGVNLGLTDSGSRLRGHHVMARRWRASAGERSRDGAAAPPARLYRPPRAPPVDGHLVRSASVEKRGSE